MTTLDGQLFVKVMDTRGLTIKDMCSVYCLLIIEKQQVKTSSVTQLRPGVQPEWGEGFTFDVTYPSSTLSIMIWASYAALPAECLGELNVPINQLRHQKPLDQWLKLNAKRSFRVVGELRLKLCYTLTNPKARGVGIDDFRLLSVLGKGTFGKVMQVRKKDTGRLYAMKVLRKDQLVDNNAVSYTIAEKNVLKQISHPFIVSLKFSFQTKDCLYMILDYIGGGELFFHLNNEHKFSEERVRFYAAEITLALCYLHENNIIYRDLKPENLLLDMSGHICLTDFGLAKVGLRKGERAFTFCGSSEYLAPEILKGEGYSYGVDWWALGTLLYELLSGLPPFFSEDLEVMNVKILTAPLSFPYDFSPDARKIVTGLLNRDPSKRLGVNGFKDFEKHPFYKNIDWQKLYNKEVDPTFIPHLREETDTDYFDPEFTAETPRHSFCRPLPESMQKLFENFSYVAEEKLLSLIEKGFPPTAATTAANTSNSTHAEPIGIGITTATTAPSRSPLLSSGELTAYSPGSVGESLSPVSSSNTSPSTSPDVDGFFFAAPKRPATHQGPRKKKSAGAKTLSAHAALLKVALAPSTSAAARKASGAPPAASPAAGGGGGGGDHDTQHEPLRR